MISEFAKLTIVVGCLLLAIGVNGHSLPSGARSPLVFSPSAARSLYTHPRQAPSATSLASLSSESAINDDPVYTWTNHTYEQTLDHFNFASPRTFTQKYIMNLTYWRRPRDANDTCGPMFVYAGNEGDIELFATHSGFMWDIAPQFNAALVFIEHRFYGASMPFGNNTYHDANNFQWLTSEQALADFTDIVLYLKRDVFQCGLMPVIAFGGSYGGLLSGYWRMKYPHIVDGALASSSGFAQFTGLGNDYTFYQSATRNFAESENGDVCVPQIRRSWDLLLKYGANEEGRQLISQIFNLCIPLGPAQFQMDDLFNMISASYVYMGMADYPYPASFMGPMPGNPVNVSCAQYINTTDEIQILRNVKAGLDIYMNYTGESSCYNTSTVGPSTIMDSIRGWWYQSCTEFLMPCGQDGIHDMFWWLPWNATLQTEWCDVTFPTIKPIPRLTWPIVNYGATDFRGHSNIIFTNGNRDPWSLGGVTWHTPGVPSLVPIWIHGGAHHLDLRAAHTGDPQSVIDARNQIRDWIAIWIDEANHPNGNDNDGKKLSDIALIAISSAVTAVVVGVTCLCYNRRSKHDGNLQSTYNNIDH